jgi:regulator of RNase E activity RraA
MGYEPDLIARYRAVAVASISDALNQLGHRGTMTHEIKPLLRAKIVGPAVTVLEEPADGAGPPTHALEAIDAAAAGSVVVISNGGDPDVSVWGGLMTAGARVRGLVGAVLDGSARDIEEIERDFGFPVFARGLSPNTTVGRYRTVARDVPVECAGVPVHPGDLVVGDPDGVVVVPGQLVSDAIERAEQIQERERRQAEAIRTLGSLVEAVERYGRI